MKFMNIGLEEEDQVEDQTQDQAAEDNTEVEDKPNETEKAIEMVNNEDSTKPAVQIKIANYKDELAALKGGDDATDSSQEPEDSSEPSSDEPEEGSEDEPDESEDSEEDSDSTDEEEVEDDDSEDSEQESNDDDSGEDSEAPAEIDDSELNAAQEGFSVLSNLYSLKEVLNKAEERNSFTPIAMETFNIALERNKKLLGVGHSTRYKTPSVEAFDSFSTRKEFIKEAQVAVENFVKDIWEGIKRFLKAIIQWFADFIMHTNKSVANAIKDVAEIRESAKHWKANEAKTDEYARKSNGKNKVEGDLDTYFKHPKAKMLIPYDINKEDHVAVLAGLDRTRELIPLFNAIRTGFNAFNNVATKIVELDHSNAEKLTTDLANLRKELDLKKVQPIPGMSSVNELEDVQISGDYELLATNYLAMSSRFYLKRAKALDDEKVLMHQHFGISVQKKERDIEVALLENSKQVEEIQKVLEFVVKDMKEAQDSLKEFNTKIKKFSDLVDNMDKTADSPGMGLKVKELNLCLTLITKVSEAGLSKLLNHFTNHIRLTKAYIKESYKARN